MVEEKGNTEPEVKKAILKRRITIVLGIVLGGACGFYILRFLLLDFLLNLLFSGLV